MNMNHLGAWSPFSLNCVPDDGLTKLFLFSLVTTSSKRQQKMFQSLLNSQSLDRNSREPYSKLCTKPFGVKVTSALLK